MLTDRANVICLLHILKEYSAESHIMPMREIMAKMATLYDIKIDRRTVYSAFELLRNLGYDISVYEENGKGYYLRAREFEPSEIRLLTDAVCSFPFIPEKQSKDLIRKLQNFNSRFERKKYDHLSVIRQSCKSQNKQVFLNIELLDEAIENKVKVCFIYLSYDAKKRLTPRREKPFIVNPYGMVYTNEHYYLVCILSGCQNISLYRIDRMSGILIMDEPTDKTGKKIPEVTMNAVYAFIGTPEPITFTFDKNVLNDVIDRFGTDIWVAENEDHYRAKIIAPPKGFKFWALQYLPYVEVLEPQSLRDAIIEAVRANKYQPL